MKGRGVLVSSLGLLLALGCIRSIDDLPERPEGAIVSGQVVTRDLVSGDWKPTSGVSVGVLGMSRATTSDDNGFFELNRLPLQRPLAVRLVAPREAGAPIRARVLDPIQAVVDGQSIDLGTVRLSRGGALAGRALLLDDPNLSPAGSGGTLVVLAQTSFKAVTDEGGAYLLPDLPEGYFDLVAFRPGYLPARLDGVGILPGGTTNARDLVLLPGEGADVMVSGTARLAELDDETSHGGIDIRFESEVDATITAETTTGPSGAFSVTVQPGVYQVTASRQGRQSVVQPGVAVLPEGVLGLSAMFLAEPGVDDFDQDGIPDSEDDDDDNDGCRDEVDAFPRNPAFCFDNDRDGIADEIDPDDDNDGLSDAEEVTPGTDDWITNPLRADTDSDGFSDLEDVCPTVPDDQTDSDSNGKGDACDPDDPINTIPGPRVTGFSPAEAGAGTVLEIFGTNFDSDVYPVQVQFGLPAEDGALVSPTTVTRNFLRLTVPSTARTGLLRVFARGRAATSTATFTFRPGPRVVDIAPRAGRRGSRVTVIGEAFDPDGLGVFLNGTQTTILPGPGGGLVQTRLVGGIAYDAIEFVVPDTTSGLVEVQNRFGTSASTTQYVVTDAGIVIERVAPNPVASGGQLTLFGRGFSTDDLIDPPPVEIIFDYGGAELRQVVLPGGNNTTVSVAVPAGATTGQVAMDHPAADQPIVYREVLVIDPLLPSLTDASDLLVRPGDAVTVFGANLLDATQIALAGGAVITAPNFTASAGTVTFTVPAGIQPGPVTVTTPRGTGVSTFRLGVIELSDAVSLPTAQLWQRGGGFGPGGQEFFGVMTGRQIFVASGTAAVPRFLRTIDLSTVLLGGEQPRLLSMPESGNVAVLSTSLGSLVLSVPSFALVGRCAYSKGNLTFQPRLKFDATTSAAYDTKPTNSMLTTLSVLRIDLSDGSCEELPVSTNSDPRPVGGVLPQANRTLLVTHPTRGAAVLNVDPQSPLYRTLSTPWTLPGVDANQLFLGPSTDVFFTTTNSPVGYFAPLGGTPPAAVLSSRGDNGFVDPSGRFLLVSFNSGTQIVDMSTVPPRIVRRDLPEVTPVYGAAKPGSDVMILSDRVPSAYRRMRIRP